MKCSIDCLQALADLYSFKAPLFPQGSISDEETGVSSPTADASQPGKSVEPGKEEAASRKWTVQHVSSRPALCQQLKAHRFFDTCQGRVVSQGLCQPLHLPHSHGMLQIVFPALRMFWKPSIRCLEDASVLELTRLEHLYRIFERC